MAKSKVLMLRNAASSFGCSLSEGETGDIDSDLADSLIAHGIAVPASIKAVPEAPQISGSDESSKPSKSSK